MILIIDLQICKAHDETVFLDVNCDSRKWILLHQLLHNLALLVSGAELRDNKLYLSD